MTTKSAITYGGAYVANSVQSGRDFVGRDVINISVKETYLHQIWRYLDADLQNAMTLANNQVQRENGAVITLEHLLMALFRLHPELAEEFAPLRQAYGGDGTAKEVEQIRWQNTKMLDVDPELQMMIFHLLARQTEHRPLSYLNLLTALENGPEPPFPELCGGTMPKQHPVKVSMPGPFPGEFYAMAVSGNKDKMVAHWKSIESEKTPPQWNEWHCWFSQHLYSDRLLDGRNYM